MKKKFNVNLCLILIILFVSASFSNIDTKARTMNQYNSDIEISDNKNTFIVELEDRPIIDLLTTFKDHITKKDYAFFSSSLKSKIISQKEKILDAQDEIITKIQSFIGSENIDNLITSRYTKLLNGFSINGISKSTAEKIEKLPNVKKVIENIKISATLDKSIPKISADDVWKIKDDSGRNITGKGVSIAILDTGVDYNHDDFKNYMGGYDFINNDDNPMDDNGHGTHCAGIILGTGNVSNGLYKGVAPDAEFYSYKILDSEGDGELQPFLDAMEHSIDPNNDDDFSDHVDIISLSVQTKTPGTPTDALCEKVDKAVDAGIIVVAAAGNLGSNKETITSPGAAIKAITVGATNDLDYIASFSSRGPVKWDGKQMSKPDIVAPGVDITSTIPGNTYGSKEGTSMATPHVAGAAALLLQAKPDSSPSKIKNLLKVTADYVGADENVYGAGRLNISNATTADIDLFFQVPEAVLERQDFTVKVCDIEGEPIKSFGILLTKFRIPRIKIGETLNFKAPFVFDKNVENITSKLILITFRPLTFKTFYIKVFNNF